MPHRSDAFGLSPALAVAEGAGFVPDNTLYVLIGMAIAHWRIETIAILIPWEH